MDLEAGSLHGETGKGNLERPGELSGDATARPGQDAGSIEVPRVCLSVRALEIRHAPIAVFKLRHLLAQRIALRDDVLQSRTEFSLQALEERQALLDLLKPRRGRVD